MLETKKVDAKLPGYDGPFFPNLIDILNNISAYVPFTVCNLRLMSVILFREYDVTTDDGYCWPLGLATRARDIKILFPRGFQIENNSRALYRSIAVYVKKNVEDNEVIYILGEIILSYKKLRSSGLVFF